MNANRMNSIVRYCTVIVTVSVVGILAIRPSEAADEMLGDRFNLSLGAFFVTRTNGRVQLDRTAGPVGITAGIDWARDLDGETSMTVPRVDGFYRFAPKHRVDYSWFYIDRTGEVATQRDIDFGDTSFPAGTTIDSRLATSTTKVTYTYSFYRAPNIETSVSAGLHVTKIKTKLQSDTLGIRQSESRTAPLPVIGFRLDYSFASKWWVRGKSELFFLNSIDKYQGTYSDFTLTVEHKTFRHVGFGGGLEFSSFDLDVTGDQERGSLSSALSGLMLYVVVR